MKAATCSCSSAVNCSTASSLNRSVWLWGPRSSSSKRSESALTLSASVRARRTSSGLAGAGFVAADLGDAGARACGELLLGKGLGLAGRDEAGGEVGVSREVR